MPDRTPLRIRGAILAVFCLLTLALVLPNVSAQLRPPGPPPRPNSPQPYIPPTMPMPGGGNFTGNGGGNMPTPGGNFTGNGGGGNFTGMPPGGGGSMFERVWTCGKCGKEIGRGSFPPSTCQFCGVHLVNGIGGGDKPIGSSNPGFPNANPGMPAPGMPPVATPPIYNNAPQNPIPPSRTIRRCTPRARRPRRLRIRPALRPAA